MVVEQRNSKGQYLPGNGPFELGVSGNPAGRPKNSVTTLLKNTDKETTQKIAKRIVKKVVDGDLGFTNLYLDRTEGKVAQQTEHTFSGEGLGSILLKLRGYREEDLSFIEEASNET